MNYFENDLAINLCSTNLYELLALDIHLVLLKLLLILLASYGLMHSLAVQAVILLAHGTLEELELCPLPVLLVHLAPTGAVDRLAVVRVRHRHLGSGGGSLEELEELVFRKKALDLLASQVGGADAVVNLMRTLYSDVFAVLDCASKAVPVNRNRRGRECVLCIAIFCYTDKT